MGKGERSWGRLGGKTSFLLLRFVAEEGSRFIDFTCLEAFESLL